MIKLEKDLYDTFEFVAEVFGGIGGGRYEDNNYNPLCIAGIISFLEDVNAFPISTTTNDQIVSAVNNRKKRAVSSRARITWAEYVKEGNIVRGK